MAKANFPSCCALWIYHDLPYDGSLKYENRTPEKAAEDLLKQMEKALQTEKRNYGVCPQYLLLVFHTKEQRGIYEALSCLPVIDRETQFPGNHGDDLMLVMMKSKDVLDFVKDTL